LNLDLSLKRTRKRGFLEQMEQVLPRAALVELIAPYYPQGRTGSPAFSLLTMLRIDFMQQWFTLSDPGMEEAFFDTPLFREFAQLDEFSRLPDETTILRFLHRLEKHTRAEKILITVNELLTARGYACARKRGKCPAKGGQGLERPKKHPDFRRLRVKSHHLKISEQPLYFEVGCSGHL